MAWLSAIHRRPIFSNGCERSVNFVDSACLSEDGISPRRAFASGVKVRCDNYGNHFQQSLEVEDKSNASSA